jgi:tol-pal system beta propeller repeat protein TolB
MGKQTALIRRTVPFSALIALVCGVMVLSAVFMGSLIPKQVISFIAPRGDHLRLHLMDIRTQLIQQVASQPVTICCPVWSPDGQKIAFAGTPTTSFVFNLDDGETYPVTPQSVSGFVSSWSPDGEQLLVEAFDDLYRIDVDGQHLLPLTSQDSTVSDAEWSPDNRFIVFVSERDGNREVYRVDKDGGEVQRLTHHPTRDYDPNISPDGSMIAFVSQRDGNDELYIMNADGSNLHRVTLTDFNEANPLWSPDGTHILFISQLGFTLPSSIGVVNADGSNLHYIVGRTTFSGLARWSPDGKFIAYISQERGGSTEIYMVHPDGNNRRRLTDNAILDTYPAWQP